MKDKINFSDSKKMYDIKPPEKGVVFGVEGVRQKDVSFKYAKSLERDVDYDIKNATFFDKQNNKKSIERLNLNNNFKKQRIKKDFGFLKLVLFSLIVAVLLSFIIIFFINQGEKSKNIILKNSLSAYEHIMSAQNYLDDMDLSGASFEFSKAREKFKIAQDEVDKWGLSLISWLPTLSVVDSGVNLIDVGLNLSKSGEIMSRAVEPLFKISGDYIFLPDDKNDVFDRKSILSSVFLGIKNSKESFENIENSLKNVDPYDFPEEFQYGVWELKNKFPKIKQKMDIVSEYSDFLSWFLGEDNPKNILLLTQNTSEARATGGFLGSYGILKTEFGFIKDVFMDDIYNIDGQLLYKSVPPRPIQKVSTAWSMHDANWFLDFPTSAKKVSFFYEKAGGVTPDAVVAINEKFIESLISVVGFIEMKDYGLVLTEENFVDLIQKEVEEDYDKVLNRPKKILNDMIPVIIDRFSDLSQDEFKKLLKTIMVNLENKNILIWANNEKYQNLLIESNWAGEVKYSGGMDDYFALVNTNINGFKTDRVIDQYIEKKVQIKDDGRIINKVKVKRIHNGGGEDKEWLNMVNSNYMRLYVPLGSRLISISGNTKEVYEPAIDYKKAGFNFDDDVLKYENSLIFDSNMSVDIFEESQKTVFGVWAYVSPGESVEISYEYELPFKIDMSKKGDDIDFYFQSQPGQESRLSFSVELPDNWSYIYSIPDKFWGEYLGDFRSDMGFSLGVNY